MGGGQHAEMSKSGPCYVEANYYSVHQKFKVSTILYYMFYQEIEEKKFSFGEQDSTHKT